MPQTLKKQDQITWNPDAMLGGLVSSIYNEISYFLLSMVFLLPFTVFIAMSHRVYTMEGTPWEYTTFTLSASATNISESISIPSGFGLTINDTKKYHPSLSVTRNVYDFTWLCLGYAFPAVLLLMIWAAHQLYYQHVLPAAVVAHTTALKPSFEHQLRSFSLVGCLICIIIGLIDAVLNICLKMAGKDCIVSSLRGLFLVAKGMSMAYIVHYRPTCDALKAGSVDQILHENQQISGNTASAQVTDSVASPEIGSFFIDTGLFRVERGCKSQATG